MIKLVGVIPSFSIDENGNKIIYLNQSYISAVVSAGGTPILIPQSVNIKALINICGGFLFSGGVDINPILYNEEPQKNLGKVSDDLDKFQIEVLVEVIKFKKPILAICRGAQLLNVFMGGTLIQDIHSSYPEAIQHLQNNDSGVGSHFVNIVESTILHELFGERTLVNSFHHQSIKDIGKNLKISAKANDGIIEAVEIEDYPFGVGVQWHPELLLSKNDNMLKLFQKFIKSIE